MKHRQVYKQGFLQKLSLTPQMRQSIKMLGMSTKDLNELIDSALEQNPFLKKDLINKEARMYEKRLNRDHATVHESFDAMSGIRQNNDPRSMLVSQAMVFGITGKQLEIIKYLIQAMDDNGYIRGPLDDIAEGITCSIDEAEKALSMLQGFEPAGIGARDLSECLQLQLERLGKKDSLEYEIVCNFSHELAQNDVKRLSKALKAPIQEVERAISNIKKLHPKPAASLLSDETKNIIPDLVMEQIGSKLILHFNKEWLPSLSIYNPYEGRQEIDQDPESEKFIKESMLAAKGLIDNLKRREKTIHKIAEYIINYQAKGLTMPDSELRPLTIKDVAAALSLNKSTVSRVVSNKYIQVGGSVIVLKKLLSKEWMKENGKTISKTAINEMIKNLIKNEGRQKPISDETISKNLKKHGIIIQRRVVAKYRNSMRILPAYLRKNLSDKK